MERKLSRVLSVRKCERARDRLTQTICHETRGRPLPTPPSYLSKSTHTMTSARSLGVGVCVGVGVALPTSRVSVRGGGLSKPAVVGITHFHNASKKNKNKQRLPASSSSSSSVVALASGVPAAAARCSLGVVPPSHLRRLEGLVVCKSSADDDALSTSRYDTAVNTTTSTTTTTMSFAAKCAATLALVIAPLAVPLAVPLAANAAKPAAAAVATPPRAHWTEYINPNVVQLPEPASEAGRVQVQLG